MHSHKVLEINKFLYNDGYYATDITMDCPVQPRKVVVTTSHMHVGEEFDPHFSNDIVVARFRPTELGWNDAVRFIS